MAIVDDLIDGEGLRSGVRWSIRPRRPSAQSCGRDREADEPAPGQF
jgi:hypothetical protein